MPRSSFITCSLARIRATCMGSLWSLLGSVLLLSACGGGGSGGGGSEPISPTALRAADLAVLFADGDASSEAIARAYQQARGIPESNMLRVSLPTRTDAISSAAFSAVPVTCLPSRQTFALVPCRQGCYRFCLSQEGTAAWLLRTPAW